MSGTHQVSKVGQLNTVPQHSKPNVAVIDNFDTKNICVDFGYTPDVAHGTVVKRLIEEGLPKAKIDCFKVNTTKSGTEVFDGVDNCLGAVLANIKKGQKYDALNLSQSCDIDLKYLSDNVGVEITPENLAQNKKAILKWLSSPKAKTSGVKLNSILDKLNKISASGTKVYIGAGNEGKKVFNLFSLANNVKTVGALDNDGKKASYSANNSLVTRWNLGSLKIQKLEDKNGKSGFDYTGDGTIDVYSDKTSCPIKISSWEELEGTSFSTPRALVRDLKNNR